MSPIAETYSDLYSALSNLREHLHLAGRIDDSNAKLDEVSKILAICIAVNRGWIKADEFEALINSSQHDHRATEVLQKTFSACAKEKPFLNSDGSSIFGAFPKLNIQDNDNEFALLLSRTLYATFSRALSHARSGCSFDLINEAFGHFVRDNFRGNIEDAQYMTPPEVVDFICEWALSEVKRHDKNFLDREFIVMDPSCGVGSFLASFYRKLSSLSEKAEKNVKLIGQDKVDRMVRLSKINMMLFGSEIYDIDQGNSLFNCGRLNRFNGKVDLILTNPPFGANISSAQITDEPAENYPLLGNASDISSSIDSELAFIDRELALLRDGGKLFIVVPDSTVSSRGLAETLRVRLMGKARLKGVVELPSVTFAQAGTRTKTSILYIEKRLDKSPDDLLAMAIIEDLGFQVSMRKGVAVKKYEGTNELSVLSKSLFNWPGGKGVVSENPSCIIEYADDVEQKSWTASHYSAKRLRATASINAILETEVKQLQEIVNFETQSRRRLKAEPGSKCISVLHVIGDGVINFNELMSYNPKTKGNVCFPGDILISKINPRIPRVIVVPDLGFPTTCSKEFEILSVKEGIDPYWVSYILLNKLVQDQIQSLTSGTSSSHNRIKTSELKIVEVPVPKTERKKIDMSKVVSTYRDSINSMILSSFNIYKMRQLQA